jgi:ubiquinone/menaquinone biosynthesis C-methylase UbiE
MYIKEDITISILRNNGFTVNSDLPTFVQGILHTKYDFIFREGDTSKIEDVNIISLQEFAILMYIFNALITVENMEIDNTCYYISLGEPNVNTYNISQDNGYDVIVTTDVNISPIFIKSPSFMLNEIVHPITYDTKTVYLDLLYKLILSDSNVNLDILIPFGEGVKNMFLEGKKQYISSYRIISKLILSQFPSFTDYMKSISEYLKQILVVTFKPSSIKNKKIDTDINFKSSIFNSMKEGIKVDEKYNSKYEEALIQKYYKYINESLQEVNPILNNNLYAYPQINNSLIYPYIEEINIEKVMSLFRVVFNAEIYFKTFNRVFVDKDINVWSTLLLDHAHKIKRCHYSLLKAFYFSYHMCFDNRYGELYYNKTPLIKPRGVILNTEFTTIKGDIYYPVWTLNQCNSIKNREIINSLILKTVWHNNKFIMRKVEVPVRKLLSEKNNDMYIFKNLNGLYKQFTPQDTGFDKGQFRYNELLKTGLFDKVIKNKNPRDIKYLDFGGGIGDVGSSISKNLGFLKENSFVTDIQNWLGKEHTEEYSKNITYRYLKTNDLPFENDSIDFITCLQVIHHIPDKKYTLSQLYRILKPGGIILVREHNCETIQDQMLIDLEHSLHGFVVDEQGQDYLQNYNDTYMNKLELSSIMISSGFKNISENVKFPEDKGVTKYYYSLWIKSTSYEENIKPVLKKSWADYSDDED